MALTGQQEQAAALVAADLLTNEEIAAEVGAGRASLCRWKLRDDFKQRVDEIRAEYSARVRRRGIAMLERRIEALNDRHQRMTRVIEQRASDPNAPQSVPGIDTGLLAPTGTTRTGRAIYGVDTALLKELRETEKQAAQELGQWLEKSETKVLGAIEINEIEVAMPIVDEG